MTPFLISQLCASYRSEADFFAKFEELARGFREVEHLAVLPVGERAPLPRPGKFFASAPVRYLGEVTGEIYLFFDIRKFPNDRPLQLVKFLARQLAMAIQSAAVYAAHEALEGRLTSLRAEVREHTLLERARGVVESQRLIPKGQGERLMKKLGDQSGRSLQDMARGILTSANGEAGRIRRSLNLYGRMPWPVHQAGERPYRTNRHGPQ